MAQADAIELVTGANRGIGFEIARQLGELGMVVIVQFRDGKMASDFALLIHPT